MNLTLNKKQKLALFSLFIFGSLTLSACGGGPGTNPLIGGAGLGEVTPTAEATEPAVIPPTEVPTIAPPAGHVVFVSDRDGAMNLYMTSPDGVEQRRLTASNSKDTDPRVSPDGT